MKNIKDCVLTIVSSGKKLLANYNTPASINLVTAGQTALFILVTSTMSFAQYFAPSLTTIYQDNEKTAGQRYGVDIKYFALLHDKELFLAGTYAYGESDTYDSDLLRLSIGCKTGDRLKYGAMASAIGYSTVNYPESTKD